MIVELGPLSLSLNSQFLGVTALAIGCQTFFLGCIALVLFDYTGRITGRLRRAFPYSRSVLVAFGLVLAGLLAAVPLIVTYVRGDFLLAQANTIPNHLAVTGLGILITGAQLFAFTLVLHGTIIATTRARPRVVTKE